MFPQFSGGTGGGFNTSSVLQQNTSLLGNPQIQSTSMPAFDPGNLGNSTAPQSSTTNPNVANMVKALKGSAQ